MTKINKRMYLFLSILQIHHPNLVAEKGRHLSSRPILTMATDIILKLTEVSKNNIQVVENSGNRNRRNLNRFSMDLRSQWETLGPLWAAWRRQIKVMLRDPEIDHYKEILRQTKWRNLRERDQTGDRTMQLLWKMVKCMTQSAVPPNLILNVHSSLTRVLKQNRRTHSKMCSPVVFNSRESRWINRRTNYKTGGTGRLPTIRMLTWGKSLRLSSINSHCNRLQKRRDQVT